MPLRLDSRARARSTLRSDGPRGAHRRLGSAVRPPTATKSTLTITGWHYSEASHEHDQGGQLRAERRRDGVPDRRRGEDRLLHVERGGHSARYECLLRDGRGRRRLPDEFYEPDGG